MFNKKIHDLLKQGKPIINCWLSIPNSFTTESMSKLKWDSLTIDIQHGANDYSSALSMLQVISNSSRIPFARVPWNEPGIIMKMLDARASGIICPMINNKNECYDFVSSCLYPPLGKRSFGPMGAQLAFGSDYYEHANSQIITLAMIETQEAVNNLDEILSIKNLSGVYIGPADMSISYGLPPKFDVKENPVYENIKLIAKKTNEHGKIAGIHTGSVAYAKEMINIGYKFITILSDFRFMSAYAENILNELEDVETVKKNSAY